VKLSGKNYRLIILLTVFAGLLIGYLIGSRARHLRETRRYSRDEIESRTATKTPRVLVLEGTLSYLYIDWGYPRATESRSTHDFELVMQGFTNYFRKETWGAERGQRYFFGGQKPGGYEVEIRTKNFTGEWNFGWAGTGGGGGGGGDDEYQDDFLPGRWLWNRNGFVGAEGDYENHSVTIQTSPYDSRLFYEEYQNCKSVDDFLIPQKIIWRESAGLNWNDDSKLNWKGEHELREEKIFKVKSFKFQDALSNGWFEAQIKEYIPDYAHEKITNAQPALVSTNR
jgi:hypothetical protein